MMKAIVGGLLILTFGVARAQHYDTLVGEAGHEKKMMVYPIGKDRFYYPRPKIYTFLLNQPRIVAGIAKETWRKKSLPAIGVIVASSAILISSDQWIANEVQQFSRYIGLDPTRKYKEVITLHLGSPPESQQRPVFPWRRLAADPDQRRPPPARRH
jgi:hypothetical protein